MDERSKAIMNAVDIVTDRLLVSTSSKASVTVSKCLVDDIRCFLLGLGYKVTVKYDTYSAGIYITK